jgi:hypothetical protein
VTPTTIIRGRYHTSLSPVGPPAAVCRTPSHGRLRRDLRL